MGWMDGYYDPAAGYLYSLDAAAALRHDTRSSAWYAIGLLARNEGDDVTNAEKILTNVVLGQYKNPTEQWYVRTTASILPQLISLSGLGTIRKNPKSRMWEL